jgi:hypothetical protein
MPERESLMNVRFRPILPDISASMLWQARVRAYFCFVQPTHEQKIGIPVIFATVPQRPYN